MSYDNKFPIVQSAIKPFTKKPSLLKPVMLSAMIGLVSVNMTGCGYNKLQEQDVSIESQWSEVLNQYQRRSDLVPQLVEVAKKYANHEEKVFTEIAQARSQVGGMKVTPEVLNNPEAMNKYAEAQAQMTGALSRLMAVAENYPELKSDKIFINLQDELAGTENRIAVARRRYIASVGEYNKTVRKFPTNITAKMFGMDTKANFSVENEKAISSAPKVDFGD